MNNIKYKSRNKTRLRINLLIILLSFYLVNNATAISVEPDNKTALVIIDVQNDYFPGGKYTLEGSKDACVNINKVLKKFRIEKRIIVHIEHKDAGTYFVPGTEGQKIHSDLTPLKEEKVIVKTAPNSFWNTELETYLKSLDIKKLIICGMQTNVCVEATVNDAISLGFTVYLMADGCAALQESTHTQTIKRLGKTSTVFNSFDLINNIYRKPESIVFNYKTGDYYISNPEGSTIVKLNSTRIPEVFVSGLSFPLGLAIIDSIIYVADSSRLKGFLLNTGSKVFDVFVSGSSRLNGITTDGDSLIFASDDTNDKIFKINVKNANYKVLIDRLIDFPNGVEYDKPNNRILFCESGTRPFISSLSLNDYTIDTLYKFSPGGMDGLTIDAKGNIYFSSWGKSGVFRCDPAFSSEPVQLTFDNSGPADIFYNSKDSIIAIPNMSGGTIDFVSCKYKTNPKDTISADTRIFSHNDNLSSYSKTAPKFSVINSLLNYGLITDSVKVILPDNLSQDALTVDNKNLQIAPSSARSLLFTIDPSKFSIGTNKIDIVINCMHSKTNQINYTLNFEITDQPLKVTYLKGDIESEAYPNPFKDCITFSYKLDNESNVNLVVYSLSGRLIKNLINFRQSAGNYKVDWNGYDSNGNKITSGAFIYCLKINNILKKGKIVQLR